MSAPCYGRDHGFVAPVKASEDIGGNLLILELLVGCCHVIGQALNFAEEFGDGGGALLGSREGHMSVDDAPARLSSLAFMDGLPDLCRGGAAGDLHLHIFGDGCKQVVEDRLVLADPFIVLRIGAELSGLVSRLSNLLRRHCCRLLIEEVRESHTADRRENMGAPHGVLFFPSFSETGQPLRENNAGGTEEVAIDEFLD